MEAERPGRVAVHEQLLSPEQQQQAEQREHEAARPRLAVSARQAGRPEHVAVREPLPAMASLADVASTNVQTMQPPRTTPSQKEQALRKTFFSATALKKDETLPAVLFCLARPTPNDRRLLIRRKNSDLVAVLLPSHLPFV